MNDRESLKRKATELGIEFPSNVKTDKLIEMISNKTGEKMPDNKVELVPEKKFLVLKTSEYEKMSKEQGTTFGRKEGQKTVCTIEELRVLINSDWTPQMVMEKHGMSEEEHKQLIWKLSEAERREKPIGFTKLAYRKG